MFGEGSHRSYLLFILGQAVDASHNKAEINNHFRLGDMVLLEILLLNMPNYQVSTQLTPREWGRGAMSKVSASAEHCASPCGIALTWFCGYCIL